MATLGQVTWLRIKQNLDSFLETSGMTMSDLAADMPSDSHASLVIVPK